MGEEAEGFVSTLILLFVKDALGAHGLQLMLRVLAKVVTCDLFFLGTTSTYGATASSSSSFFSISISHLNLNCCSTCPFSYRSVPSLFPSSLYAESVLLRNTKPIYKQEICSFEWYPSLERLTRLIRQASDYVVMTLHRLSWNLKTKTFVLTTQKCMVLLLISMSINTLCIISFGEGRVVRGRRGI